MDLWCVLSDERVIQNIFICFNDVAVNKNKDTYY